MENGKVVADARVDKLVSDYIATRNYIKNLKKKHEDELAEFELALEKLKGRLLLFLASTGRAGHGRYGVSYGKRHCLIE